tara:strand:+ start:931 stop:1446 length:516 start_codon:yes stop_codon:yes gene_type:complete
MKKLQEIQSELKAPKNQRNNFGKYNYRSCEDILEAVKPLLKKHNCILTISDEIKELGNILFVESVAVISDGENQVHAKGQAGIDINRKGMDISQSFGSSSSYARKYALNGLFLIDDTKDADTQKPPVKAISKPLFTEDNFEKAHKVGATLDKIKTMYSISKENELKYLNYK